MGPMTLALTLLCLAQAPAQLAGTWEFDAAKSDDPGPMMETLGVPAYLKSLAPKKPQQEIALGEGTITITAQSPKGQRSETLRLDGKTANKAELMGSALEVVTAVEEGAVVSRGTLVVEGAKKPVVLRRKADGGVMTVELTVGEQKLRRVFNRVR